MCLQTMIDQARRLVRGMAVVNRMCRVELKAALKRLDDYMKIRVRHPEGTLERDKVTLSGIM